MRKYVLLFIEMQLIPPAVRNIINQIHSSMESHNCPECNKQDNCPIKNDPQARMPSLCAADDDDFSVMKSLIEQLYKKNDVLLMFLIDHEKSIGYLYKAKGEFEFLKGTVLKSLLGTYESIDKKNCGHIEMRDVRDAMGASSIMS